MRRIAMLVLLLGGLGCDGDRKEALEQSCAPVPGEITPCSGGRFCIADRLVSTSPLVYEGHCTATCTADADCDTGCCAPSGDMPHVSLCAGVEFCAGH